MNFITKSQMQSVKLKDIRHAWKIYYLDQSLSKHDQLDPKIYGIVVLFFLNFTNKVRCFHHNLKLLMT